MYLQYYYAYIRHALIILSDLCAFLCELEKIENN